MKVMLVNGSSHLHGTTMAALEEMIKGISFRRSRNRGCSAWRKADSRLSSM